MSGKMNDTTIEELFNLQKENQYMIYIKGQYIGIRHTIKESIELYNQYCEQYNLPKQEYKGEDLK